MSININDVNIPINSEKRDPFYGRSKSEVGLGLVSNMSFEDIETSILANVKNAVDEGIVYNYEDRASDSKPIIADLVKLKPNSARTIINFSIGTWTNDSEFIPREAARLELMSNRTNVSYNLFITEPYPNNVSSESSDDSINRLSSLTSTKVIIKEFSSGGWLVSLKIIDKFIDAIWINLVDSKNIDVINPSSGVYDDSEFDRVIEFYCDKSRISTGLDLSSSITASSLNHPILLKVNSKDPEDYYNTNSKTYTITGVDLSSSIVDKEESLPDIPIYTDESSCSKSQGFPLSVNRINHLIKFRLSGGIHSDLLSSWKEANLDQSNISSFIDTDIDSINEFPVDICEMTHDIDLRIGKSDYYGSAPESGVSGGDGYGQYEFEGGKVNYATIQSESNKRNEYHKYDLNSKSWILSSEKLDIEDRDKCLSIDTKQGGLSDLNLVIHGLDHDLKLEVVNSDYRKSRGSATDENGLLNSKRKIDSGVENLTWREYSDVEDEDRVNSYATGSIKINSFEKSIYQCLDLKIHGLDHTINSEFYRVKVTDQIKGPDSFDVIKSSTFRPNSDGKDILGSISIDTFTKRTQKFNLEVIDSRYSDCSRGLSLKYDGNFMPYDSIDDLGEYGNYIPSNPSSDEIKEIYPTINGIPFTGDFRYNVKYPPEMEQDGISKNHSVRNIVVPAYHSSPSKSGSGSHNWEVLNSIRVASIDESGNPSSTIMSYSSSDQSQTESYYGYGLVKLSTLDSSVINSKNLSRSYDLLMDSLGEDNDVISVKLLKSILGVINSRIKELENK